MQEDAVDEENVDNELGVQNAEIEPVVQDAEIEPVVQNASYDLGDMDFEGAMPVVSIFLKTHFKLVKSVKSVVYSFRISFPGNGC